MKNILVIVAALSLVGCLHRYSGKMTYQECNAECGSGGLSVLSVQNNECICDPRTCTIPSGCRSFPTDPNLPAVPALPQPGNPIKPGQKQDPITNQM